MEAIAIRLEAIAIRLEAVAIKLKAIAIRSEAIAIRLEAIALRLEAVAIWLEAIAIRLEAIAFGLKAIAIRFVRDHWPGTLAQQFGFLWPVQVQSVVHTEEAPATYGVARSGAEAPAPPRSRSRQGA